MDLRQRKSKIVMYRQIHVTSGNVSVILYNYTRQILCVDCICKCFCYFCGLGAARIPSTTVVYSSYGLYSPVL